MIRTYSELITFKTFEQRFEYLRLNGVVGESTFGYDRYLNQLLYRSTRWRRTRNDIIIRDKGCDLGIEDCEIMDMIIVHHMDPITIDDIELNRSKVFDPEGLICTSSYTHKGIHFSDERLLPPKLVIRRPNDMSPWRK